LNGVEMTVSVELGRTRMLVKDLLSLGPGSLVELDRPTGSPVDILVNGTLLAHGEVVVVDDEFGVRVTDVVGSSEHEEQSLSGLGESRS
jgi:flagellar motor switch protein FliN/FliY